MTFIYSEDFESYAFNSPSSATGWTNTGAVSATVNYHNNGQEISSVVSKALGGSDNCSFQRVFATGGTLTYTARGRSDTTVGCRVNGTFVHNDNVTLTPISRTVSVPDGGTVEFVLGTSDGWSVSVDNLTLASANQLQLSHFDTETLGVIAEPNEVQLSKFDMEVLGVLGQPNELHLSKFDMEVLGSTITPPFELALSASPATIEVGQSSLLTVTRSGGEPTAGLPTVPVEIASTLISPALPFTSNNATAALSLNTEGQTITAFRLEVDYSIQNPNAFNVVLRNPSNTQILGTGGNFNGQAAGVRGVATFALTANQAVTGNWSVFVQDAADNDMTLFGVRLVATYQRLRNTATDEITVALSAVAPGAGDIPAELLVLGGGGGGGEGGGGAGGLIIQNLNLSHGTSYSISVGNGGNRSINGSAAATNGSNSVFGNLTAIGGGAGGTTSSPNGNNGGSGGGGRRDNGGAGGSGTAGQGNAGARGLANSWGGAGGGGGAGAAGQAGNGGSNSNEKGGNGGNGLSSSITGTAVTYGGGGGGGTEGNSGLFGAGGTGGGGRGASPAAVATDGTANLGGGGGGGFAANGGNAGGNGGRGVVILAYPDIYPALTNIPGGLTFDQPSRPGYRVYRFTNGSGNIVPTTNQASSPVTVPSTVVIPANQLSATANATGVSIGDAIITATYAAASANVAVSVTAATSVRHSLLMGMAV